MQTTTRNYEQDAHKSFLISKQNKLSELEELSGSVEDLDQSDLTLKYTVAGGIDGTSVCFHSDKN
ncbi:hypothetical protein [Neptuniibacter caesariensis]|uniref:Uncharacterized protein n=1 Tax=Neptuniibacter caesariensis TaxID=207954 RepID=A0A7U8GTZ2_NEPCE|nr:hypothetical protein [Neptuniibacter caesariensis]EAR62797.1 hypothetical protein MED92_06756 [Oceanospirillum sp. MED92] [Neptuniibacter caesariensis]